MARALYARNFLFPGSHLVQLGATLMPANHYLLVLRELGPGADIALVLNNATFVDCHRTVRSTM